MAMLTAWMCVCLLVATAVALFQKVMQAVSPNPGEPEPSWAVILLLIQFTFITLYASYQMEPK